MPDGSSKENAVLVYAEWRQQGITRAYEPVYVLDGKCPRCGREMTLNGPGRQWCRGCRLWMLYVEKPSAIVG